MPEIFIRISIAIIVAALAACGGNETKRSVVRSTPAFCISPIGETVSPCPNVSPEDDHVMRISHFCQGVGIVGEWGTTFVVDTTLKYYVRPPADSCGYDVVDETIVSSEEDPIGTLYYSEIGSNAGGLKLTALNNRPNWYQLNFNQEDIYCEPAVCGDASSGTSIYVSDSAVFELVSIDGQRAFQLIAR